MQQRIRAAGILVDEEQRMLLVREQCVDSGDAIWVPPGGGFESCDSSLPDCVRREIEEETGLQVEVGQLLYLREFVEPEIRRHSLELFFAVHSPRGTLRDNPPAGQDLAKQSRWFQREELRLINLAPPELRDEFWQIPAEAQARTCYLGKVSAGKSERARHSAGPDEKFG